jgi:hypothetical protein
METHSSLLAFPDEIGCDLRDLYPRDFIDIQSFIWVLGSDEYEEQTALAIRRHSSSLRDCFSGLPIA